MDQRFINKTMSVQIQLHQQQILRLKKEVMELHRQIASIQANCQHVFLETDCTRKCLKCDYTESLHY